MFNAVRGIEKRGPVAGSAASPLRSQQANRIQAQHDRAVSPQVAKNSQYGGMSYSIKTAENQVQRVFTHLCTVDGQGEGPHEQAHRNTITSLCVVPSTVVSARTRTEAAGFEVATERSPGGPLAHQNRYFHAVKKLFTCSLDSTIKCWNFSEASSTVGTMSQAAAHLQPQHANLGILDQAQTPHYSVQSQAGHQLMVNQSSARADTSPFGNLDPNKLSYQYSEIQPTGRAQKRVKFSALAYFEPHDILVSGGSDRFINIYENCYLSGGADLTPVAGRMGSDAQGRAESMRYRCTAKIAK